MEIKEKCSLLIDQLYEKHILHKEEYLFLIENKEICKDELFQKARETADQVYGKDIYIRGLIEFSSWCRNDCLYCGLRRSNHNAERYRLSEEQILYCTDTGYQLGFRTFVLQGGEDPWYTDERMESIVRNIKKKHPDCAVTLSLGERSFESYRRLKEAGADRYLLRHETADPAHYRKLHPETMSPENRMRCLRDLKEIGFQTGCGIMVGSPYQTSSELAEDLAFIRSFRPDMCGIGPFIPHRDTPFGNETPGTAELTCFLLSMIRLIHPAVLLPSTTALATIDPGGREKGLLSGANVVMPNLSPKEIRGKYELYDHKLHEGEESAQGFRALSEKIRSLGLEPAVDRGDIRKEE